MTQQIAVEKMTSKNSFLKFSQNVWTDWRFWCLLLAVAAFALAVFKRGAKSRAIDQLDRSTWVISNDTDVEIMSITVDGLDGNMQLRTEPISSRSTQSIQTPLRDFAGSYSVSVSFTASKSELRGTFTYSAPPGTNLYLERCRLVVVDDKVIPRFEFTDAKDSHLF